MQPVLLVREGTEIHDPAVVHGTSDEKLATRGGCVHTMPGICVSQSDSLGSRSSRCKTE